MTRSSWQRTSGPSKVPEGTKFQNSVISQHPVLVAHKTHLNLLPDPLEKGLTTHSSILGLSCGSTGKESICNAGDLGMIPGLGRSPGEGSSYPLQYSGLENSTDCIVHGVTKSQTRLSLQPAIFLVSWLQNKVPFSSQHPISD